MFKSGFIAIIGRPNVGKSTILNAIVGEKLAIISPKAQTTRHKALAIYCDEEAQMIFLDTPGFHRAKTKLGDFMVGEVMSSLEEVDIVMLVVDRAGLGDIEEQLIQVIKRSDAKKILVINKTDTMDPDAYLSFYNQSTASGIFDHVIGIAAQQGLGILELNRLIKNELPEGPHYYPPDQLTDQTERTLVGELIREKALLFLSDEVPHGIAVDIVKMKLRKDQNIYDIDADIICERESHKGIVIGKSGHTLKGIGKAAREDMERLLDCKVNLKLFVKVREDWRNSASHLSGLGYKK
ncbi:MAG: GTPase Era [Bacillota bacterium]|nr:GTPase Era [Bacillota bacterium]